MSTSDRAKQITALLDGMEAGPERAALRREYRALTGRPAPGTHEAACSPEREPVNEARMIARRVARSSR
jgi:hypothetical protein